MGLDLAVVSGYGLGDRVGPVKFGTFKIPGFDLANRPKSLASAYSAVKALVSQNNVEGVVIEAPFPTGATKKNKRGIRTGTSAHGIQVLTMLSGAVQAGAFSGGAKYFWMPYPNEWRKEVLGNGYPNDPKFEASRYCRLVLNLDVQDHNAAEGCCLMVYGHGQAKLL